MNICNRNNPLDKLPWNDIFEELNKNYLTLVDSRYPPGSELNELLKTLIVTNISYNDAPFGNHVQDIPYQKNFLGQAAEELTKSLHDILINKHKAPADIVAPIFVSLFSGHTITPIIHDCSQMAYICGNSFPVSCC